MLDCIDRKNSACHSTTNRKKKSSNNPNSPSADECGTPRALGRAVLPIQSTQGGALHRLGASRGSRSQDPLYLLHCQASPDPYPTLLPASALSLRAGPSLSSYQVFPASILCVSISRALFIIQHDHALPLPSASLLGKKSALRQWGLECFAHSCFSESWGSLYQNCS